MINIYHNKNCSKSRQAVELLESKNIAHTVILYTKTGWDNDTLNRLIKKAGGNVHDILRPADKFYKEHDLSNKSESEIIKIAIENPTVIERPLIETETNAFVARPVDKLNDIL